MLASRARLLGKPFLNLASKEQTASANAKGGRHWQAEAKPVARRVLGDLKNPANIMQCHSFHDGTSIKAETSRCLIL